MKRLVQILTAAGMLCLAGSVIGAPQVAFRDIGPLLSGRQMHAAAYDTTHTTLYVLGGNVDTFGDPTLDPPGLYNDSISTQYYKLDLSGPLPAVVGAGWGPPMTQFRVNCGTTDDNLAAYNADGALVINNRLYFTPANSNADIPWSFNDVLVTDISSTGALTGTWQVAGNPPVNTPGDLIFDAQWAFHPGSQRLYRVSGREAGEGCLGTAASYVARVDSVGVKADGTLDAATWRSEAPLPAARRWGMLEIIGNLAINVGGISSAGAYTNTVYVAQLDPTTGAISSWATSANLYPTVAGMISGCSDGGYVYVLTGREGSAVNITTARRAKVNLAGTDIDPWETVAILPYSNRYAAATGGAGQFFITGARNYNADSTVITNDIFALSYAPAAVGSVASLGTWDTNNAFTMVRRTDTVAAPKNHNVWDAAYAPTPATSVEFKILKNQQVGWGSPNEIGRGGSNESYFSTATTDTITLCEKVPLPAGWTPATYTVGVKTSYTWVAVGEFQSEAGESGDWVPNSTITVFHDDGLNGDSVAGDGIYSYQVQLGTGVTLTNALWKVVRQGGWGGSTKVGPDGWAADPGDASNATVTADDLDILKFEFIPERGAMRVTVTSVPPTSVQNWDLF